MFALLDIEQQTSFIHFVLEELETENLPANVLPCSKLSPLETTVCSKQPMTEIWKEDLYFCLEARTVCIRGQEIELTSKEFDILALLIMNPKRVFTYEIITDLIWHEDYTCYSRKTINNHVSNLRKKLKISPDDKQYIKNVNGVGYKFDSS